MSKSNQQSFQQTITHNYTLDCLLQEKRSSRDKCCETHLRFAINDSKKKGTNWLCFSICIRQLDGNMNCSDNTIDPSINLIFESNLRNNKTVHNFKIL
mmetsp:Transcript_31391/g.34744  ORF Transcript_31391/g.34744 Transcript_31391/m.34744 type:complete len:98 (+) Transcript_31391:163-456(+)